MQNREMLFFIGNCLGLRQFPERVPEIREILKSGQISWEKLVWVSSRQLVLPALYVQLRDADLLGDLPDDLVAHLENLHAVNVRRNRIIQNQIDVIVDLLNRDGIVPIFMKGSAHMMQGLYSDIGERMIGDIDFLVPLEQILPTVELLKGAGYSNPEGPESLETMKHYPRLRNETVAAAIEVHRQPVARPFDRRFNFDFIYNNIERLEMEGDAYALSYPHQIIHNIMNTQMNDNAFKHWKISLKQMYDLLLLSQRADPLETVDQFAHFPKQLNANLIIASNLMNHPASLPYNDNKFTRRYYRRVIYFIEHPKIHRAIRILQYLVKRITVYVSLPVNAIYNKDERKVLMKRIGDRGWYNRHLSSWRRIRNV
ncbi:MAG: nucleotidyltransferase family protein [Bacteroidota bacterium]